MCCRPRPLALALALLLAGGAALRAQEAPRNYWNLREPVHSETHAQGLARPAGDTAPSAPEPTAPPPPAGSQAGPPATKPPTASAPSSAAAVPAAPARPATAPPPRESAHPAAAPATAAPSSGGEAAGAESEPRSVDALYRLGEQAQRQGHVQDAERFYRELLKRAPYHFLTQLALGRLYLRLDPAQAREHLEIARRVHPSSEDAHYLLGQTYEALGRDLDAAEAYRRAIYLNPRFYDANTRLRGVLRRMRAGRSVVERAAESFNQNPNLATLTLFGRLVMEQIEPRQAVLEFEELRRRQPDLPEVDLWLARARRAAQDLPGEISAYRSYLERRPDAIGVRLTLVERLAERGWYQDASALIKPFDVPSGGVAGGLPPATRSRVTFLRSRLLSAQREPGRAGEMLLLAHEQGYSDEEILRAYAEDLALYPAAPALWFAYGNWLRDTGKPAEAADALATAGRMDATHLRKARLLLNRMHDTGVAPAATALALGELAWADHDGERALGFLAAVPPGDPLDHRASLLRGLVYRARGDTEAALDAFTRYVFFYDDPRDMLFARGNLFWVLGRKEEALAVWQQNPDVLLQHPELLEHVADYYRSQSAAAEEMAARERLAQAVPANAVNRIRLGELYAQQGRTLEAVLLWERVLAERPRDPDLLTRVGKGWLALGDRDRALPLLQRASQMQPLDAETSALLARELYRTRQYEEALRVYWALYQTAPTHPDLPRVLPELVLSLPATPAQISAAAAFALQAGRLDQATELLEAKLAATPNDPETRMQLAEIYLRQNRLPQAEAVLQSPYNSPESDAQALALMATVQERMDRKADLVVTLERLQALRPDDAELSRRRGLLLAQLRRPGDARPLLDRALLNAPHDVTLRMALSDVTLALGDFAAAESHLNAVLAEAPGQVEAQRRLIELLLREQRWDAVATRLEAWVAANPRDATARYNLIAAYLKEFRTEAARPHYEVLQQLSAVRAQPLQPYFRR